MNVRPEATRGKAGLAPAFFMLAAVLVAGRARAGETPPPPSAPPKTSDAASPLAQGRFGSMHMTLQKTFLRINVATIDVRVDRRAQGRFATVARDQPYSEAMAGPLADVVIGAERAVVEMRFLRDVPLKRWIGVVADTLEQAREAGLISKETENEVKQGLPGWFAALRDRGYEKGDRLTYTIDPDSLHTVVASKDGPVLVDRVDRGANPRRVVLASYFAPKSEFREPLLRSLVEPAR